MNEAELAADADKSPGVLMASGYIAGGAIAGILIAFMAGVLEKTDSALTKWANVHNPFFAGASADALALIPFAVITLTLLGGGMGKGLGAKKGGFHTPLVRNGSRWRDSPAPARVVFVASSVRPGAAPRARSGCRGRRPAPARRPRGSPPRKRAGRAAPTVGTAPRARVRARA